VHLAGLEQVHLVVRVARPGRHKAYRAAALGAQAGALGGGVERIERRRRTEDLEPRTERRVDGVG